MANDINAITLSCYKGKYGQINMVMLMLLWVTDSSAYFKVWPNTVKYGQIRANMAKKKVLRLYNLRTGICILIFMQLRVTNS